jgi:DNA-binding MarR family transcriptional regulator
VPIDRRSAAIVLTAAGKARLAAARAIIETFERGLLERIPAAHRDHFVPALQALIG